MNGYGGNGYTTTLPLEVFTQRNFVEDFIRLKWNFIQKTKMLSEPPFGGRRGNVRTPSLESPCMVDFLFVIIELFATSYG